MSSALDLDQEGRGLEPMLLGFGYEEAAMRV